ncbi:MAG TPA: zinc ribbon domain-containing protein [Mycobacterium sp.]|nr:zinc ribbon domain-containing protein [Mycobacterium sp.]
MTASIPTTTCRVCGTEVPVGAFCGFCGAQLAPQRGNGPDWLRVRAYSAADGENVLRLSLVSSLFPHLPHRSRSTFRWGLAALIIVLVVFALLRWQAPLVAMCALGFPVLFLIYIEESDVYGDDDLPVSTMLLTAVLGAALGVAWAWWTGPIVARSYVAFGGLTSDRVLSGLGIPLGGAVLMLVPAVVVRLLRPRNLESLDGFLIGSLSAVSFTAAGTLVRLTPQLVLRFYDTGQPVNVFLVEAGIQGVAVPLTAAALGGMFGSALWYTLQGERRRQRFAAAVVPAIVLILAVYALLGLIDIATMRQEFQLALHLLIAAVAVLALRIGLHLALLKETREEMRGEPILCAECRHVVPDMAFCPNCGVAMRAASRTSRTTRRLTTETT